MVSEELINMIYTRNPFENLRIPGFKLTNKAPIDYVVDTLLKIKNLFESYLVIPMVQQVFYKHFAVKTYLNLNLPIL